MILFISLLVESRSRQAQVGHREPLPALSYCTPEQLRPCILSFTLDADGRMVINVLRDPSSPDFYITIKQDRGEYTYECLKGRRSSVSTSCTGEPMPVGQPLQFLMASKKESIPLAQGTFPIIGLALATPEPVRTPTAVPSFDRPPR
jgi:hypothetical protein